MRVVEIQLSDSLSLRYISFCNVLESKRDFFLISMTSVLRQQNDLLYALLFADESKVQQFTQKQAQDLKGHEIHASTLYALAHVKILVN